MGEEKGLSRKLPIVELFQDVLVVLGYSLSSILIFQFYGIFL